jgi:hypothetical protein
MKITNQTADEMSLKSGNLSGKIFGIIAAVGSLAIGGYVYFSHGWSAPLWIAVAVFVVGLLIFLSAASISVTINKPNNQINFSKKEIIGSKQATYAISDVLRVETRKQWRMESEGGGNGSVPQMRQVLVSQSVIVFKDGTELPLDNQSGGTGVGMGGVMMSGSGKETALATQVATFMGVPFQEIMPPSGGMGIGGTGINIGGIQL